MLQYLEVTPQDSERQFRFESAGDYSAEKMLKDGEIYLCHPSKVDNLSRSTIVSAASPERILKLAPADKEPGCPLDHPCILESSVIEIDSVSGQSFKI